jgi:hypothetical protein
VQGVECSNHFAPTTIPEVGVPDCRNCGNSIAATARFCAYCGAPQPLQPSSQPAAGPSPDAALEASDVTIILPRRRANATLAPAARPDDVSQSAPAASPHAADTPDAPRSRASVLKIGGAAAIVIVAAVAAAAFYATRVGAPAKSNETPAVTVTTPVAAPVEAARRSDASDAAPTKAEAPSIPAVETVTNANEAPIAAAPAAPEVTPAVSATPKEVPPRDAAPRKRARASAAPAAEPAPAEPAPAAPVVVAPPAPAPVTTPPAEPVKVEKVACADSSNPFSREACLWQECAKPEFRAHAECARFTGPTGRR